MEAGSKPDFAFSPICPCRVMCKIDFFSIDNPLAFPILEKLKMMITHIIKPNIDTINAAQKLGQNILPHETFCTDII